MKNKQTKFLGKSKIIQFLALSSFLIPIPFLSHNRLSAALEFQWDQDSGYRRLKWFQKNNEKGLDWETIKTDPTPSNYERFIHSIKTGKNDQPDFKRGADIQKILDSCFISSEKNQWIDLNT